MSIAIRLYVFAGPVPEIAPAAVLRDVAPGAYFIPLWCTKGRSFVMESSRDPNWSEVYLSAVRATNINVPSDAPTTRTVELALPVTFVCSPLRYVYGLLNTAMGAPVESIEVCYLVSQDPSQTIANLVKDIVASPASYTDSFYALHPKLEHRLHTTMADPEPSLMELPERVPACVHPLLDRACPWDCPRPTLPLTTSIRHYIPPHVPSTLPPPDDLIGTPPSHRPIKYAFMILLNATIPDERLPDGFTGLQYPVVNLQSVLSPDLSQRHFRCKELGRTLYLRRDALVGDVEFDNGYRARVTYARWDMGESPPGRLRGRFHQPSRHLRGVLHYIY